MRLSSGEGRNCKRNHEDAEARYECWSLTNNDEFATYFQPLHPNFVLSSARWSTCFRAEMRLAVSPGRVSGHNETGQVPSTKDDHDHSTRRQGTETAESPSTAQAGASRCVGRVRVPQSERPASRGWSSFQRLGIGRPVSFAASGADVLECGGRAVREVSLQRL